MMNLFYTISPIPYLLFEMRVTCTGKSRFNPLDRNSSTPLAPQLQLKTFWPWGGGKVTKQY